MQKRACMPHRFVESKTKYVFDDSIRVDAMPQAYFESEHIFCQLIYLCTSDDYLMTIEIERCRNI